MSADFRIGDWIVRPQRRIVERGEESNHIKPKSMAVFECLVNANGAPVSRNDLFDTVWPGGEVSDDTLNRCIFELRKAFADSARTPRVIETIPKFGFRLLLPVHPLEDEPLTADLLPDDSQHIHRDQWRDGFEHRPAIAVLPFANLGSDTASSYFSDGMSEEILNALAKFNRLPVIARTSSFRFKCQNRDIKEIGQLLGVTHVLEGTVRKEGKSVRLTAQLIDTMAGTHIWSEAYQREMRSTFQLQNEIARDIVDQVCVALGAQDSMLLNDLPSAQFMDVHPTSNLGAYELYLKGMQLVTNTNPGPSEQAVDYFDRAIALDNDYADAWAARGYALHALGRAGYGHSHIPASLYPDAIAAYRKALELDPGHASAMGWLGALLIYSEFKWAEGMQLMQQSLTRDPSNVVLMALYGAYLDMMKIEGASNVIDRAFRLNPVDVATTTLMAGYLLKKGRVDDAANLIEISLISDADGYAPNYITGVFNLLLVRLEVAEERFKKARLAANPVDRSLDAVEAAIARLRGEAPRLTVEEFIKIAEEERVAYFVFGDLLGLSWKDEKTAVAVFDLAIRQRQREVHEWLFGRLGLKPVLIPEVDWQRMKEITGVTQFQSNRLARRAITQYVARNFSE